MSHIALLINTFQARFEPVGPFFSAALAQAWVDKQPKPSEWAVLPMRSPDSAKTADPTRRKR